MSHGSDQFEVSTDENEDDDKLNGSGTDSLSLSTNMCVYPFV